jgi:protein tyrosine phosphatase (PTP) superfamily phosphohydrolase (DUF442 family)
MKAAPLNPSPPDLTGILHFRAISARIGTAGQPTAAQFALIREAGYDIVINLALPTSDNALADEGSLVAGLGMTYVHIPVNFTRPTAGDFEAFAGVLDAFRSRRVFVHCAMNMRVSAFVFVYRVLRGEATRFIEERLSAGGDASPGAESNPPQALTCGGHRECWWPCVNS